MPEIMLALSSPPLPPHSTIPARREWYCVGLDNADRLACAPLAGVDARRFSFTWNSGG